ncbi:RNA-directed DNA polymerase, eukaryota, reverse transcriptase zinc-binding domain protein [Tanacetum coccineum]
MLTICGILVEGSWVDSPNIVKNEFLSHFKNRFDKPQQRRTQINMTFPHMITADQKPDLECDVSREEIKRAVWGDKFSGPGGFLIWILFNSLECSFEKSGRGSKPDANMVMDFRPISLIGSLYKIIAKVLANRLVVVLVDIVNEVQSAFVADRQILDGPFILNEVVQWCKAKKKQAMIFKVDFEKAYDSVRWDYLDCNIPYFQVASNVLRDILSVIIGLSVLKHPNVTIPLLPDFGVVTDGTRAKNPSSLSDIHASVFPDPYLLF